MKKKEKEKASLPADLLAGAITGMGVGLFLGGENVVRFYKDRKYRIQVLKQWLSDPDLKEAIARKQQKIFQQKLQQVGKSLSDKELKQLLRQSRKQVLRRNFMRGLIAAELGEPAIKGAVYGTLLTLGERIIPHYATEANSRNQQ